MQQVLCRYCGEEVPEGAKSCPKCGTTVQQPVEEMGIDRQSVDTARVSKVKKIAFWIGFAGVILSLVSVMLPFYGNKDSGWYYLIWLMRFFLISVGLLSAFSLITNENKRMKRIILGLSAIILLWFFLNFLFNVLPPHNDDTYRRAVNEHWGWPSILLLLFLSGVNLVGAVFVSRWTPLLRMSVMLITAAVLLWCVFSYVGETVLGTYYVLAIGGWGLLFGAVLILISALLSFYTLTNEKANL